MLASILGMISGGATHIGVATDHVIESFRNRLWPDYKTGEGIEPNLLAQFPLLEEALSALGIVVWPMVEFEADDALAAAAVAAAGDVRVERVIICTPDKDLAQCVRGTRIVQMERSPVARTQPCGAGVFHIRYLVSNAERGTLVFDLAAGRQIFQLPLVPLQLRERQRGVLPDGLRPAPLPLVPEQVVLGFRVLFFLFIDDGDQRLQATVAGDGGAGEGSIAIRLADIEVEGGGFVCHETSFSEMPVSE